MPKGNSAVTPVSEGGKHPHKSQPQFMFTASLWEILGGGSDSSLLTWLWPTWLEPEVPAWERRSSAGLLTAVTVCKRQEGRIIFIIMPPNNVGFMWKSSEMYR